MGVGAGGHWLMESYGSDHLSRCGDGGSQTVLLMGDHGGLAAEGGAASCVQVRDCVSVFGRSLRFCVESA